ncbi:MAG: N-acetyltransferase [Chloroflexi bacterium]|nr:N-acetyltransferase [Chloroflexota bacterium]
MNANFWRGDKIRLRAVEQKDLEEIMRAIEEPDSWLERADDHIYLPSWREKERDGLASQRERAGNSCLLMIENAAGQVVGNIATFDCDPRVGTFKYSIVIKRPFWSQGYAREAITILLRYYFRELRYQKCTVLVYSFNERSLRLHERLGFQLEGRLRRTVYTNGTFYDEVYYGITCEEFDQLDPKPDLTAMAQ